MRLCLIRHFPPAVTPGVCYGHTDLPLKTPVHCDPARVDGLREQLAQQTMINAPVFSSPLQRCRDLASVLSPDYIEDARLRELNFGDWEMQAWDAIGPTALDAWAANIAGFRPPGGETGHELQQRVLAWLREISDRHHHAIVVTHAGVIRALQAHHQRLSGTNWLKLRYDYGELLYLDFTLEQIQAAPVQ